MSAEQPVHATPSTSRHCPRCGKSVPPVDLVTECPHCGYETRQPRPMPLTETIALGDDASAASADVPLETAVEAPVPDRDALVGTDLDIYRVDALLGRGGMGLV